MCSIVTLAPNTPIVIDFKSLPAKFYKPCVDMEQFSWEAVENMATSDGLSIEDFLAWFRFGKKKKYQAGIISF